MKKNVTYSVVLRDFVLGTESTDLVASRDACIERAKHLSSISYFTSMYDILVRKQVVSVSDIIFNPIY